jgi:predicted short-subunit dehydrogenase-like oxidoreductase (DUF2520 family)
VSERLVIVGPGKLGLALGSALWQADAVESLVYQGRRPEPPSHPLFNQGVARYVFGLERPREGTTAIFLAVPDDVIREIAGGLARQGDAPERCAAFHMSGALSTDALLSLHEVGYHVGSFYPLQTVAHPVTGADRLAGSSIAVAGEPPALQVAYRLLGALGCRALAVPARYRPTQHAAAVLGSNYLAVVLAAAYRLLGSAGVPGDEAMAALLALARGTIDNIEEMGFEHALVGPVTRGEVETLSLHLRSLDARSREVYQVLGRELLKLLGPEDIDEETMHSVWKLFEVEQ